MKIYTEKEAFKLNREEQEVVLTKRNITFNKYDKEKDLVNKILDSNVSSIEIIPEKKEILCHRCYTKMNIVSYGSHGIDYICPKCCAGKTIN